MKYKPIKFGNYWFVGEGRSYYPDTKSDNKLDAEIQACEMSARWHRNKIDEAHLRWEELMKEKHGDDITPMGLNQQWSDIMA